MTGKIFIATDRLTSILEKLSAEIDLWVPAQSQSDKREPTEFVPYHAGMVPALDRQTTLPLKKILLPQVETLLRFEYRKDPQNPVKTTAILDDKTEVRPALVFGARPCDVESSSDLRPSLHQRPLCGPVLS